jgi:hypothetical protein
LLIPQPPPGVQGNQPYHFIGSPSPKSDRLLGEGFELVYDRWVDAAELRAWLASRNPAGLSGDIYAVRLDKDETPGR